MALAARAERARVLAGPRQHKTAWHPHLLGAARPRRRGDRVPPLQRMSPELALRDILHCHPS